VTYVHMSNRDKEAKFRSALTRMALARDEIEYLSSGGLCDAGYVLAALDTAIGQFTAWRLPVRLIRRVRRRRSGSSWAICSRSSTRC